MATVTEPSDPATDPTRELLVADLEHRIRQLESGTEADTGRFTSLDWFWCVAGSLVVPAAAMWWFAP